MKLSVLPRALNDSALEWLIFVLRYSSVAAMLVALGAAAFGSAPRTYLVLGAYAVVAGTVGWWLLGNPEWRHRPESCGARYQGLVCTQAVEVRPVAHDGAHWDAVRDPARATLWR